MKVDGHYIRMKDCLWFKGRADAILEAKNAVEREKRLSWLSEGILAFCLNPSASRLKTNDAERLLFKQFIEGRR